MDFLRSFAGIIFILCMSKLFYEFAVLISSKAKFYERFLSLIEKFKERKKI